MTPVSLRPGVYEGVIAWKQRGSVGARVRVPGDLVGYRVFFCHAPTAEDFVIGETVQVEIKELSNDA